MEKLDFSFRKKKRWLTLLSFCMMLFMGQISFAQTYCTTSFASGCTDDHIDDFTIPDVGFSHLGTGCSTDQYGDYTAMTIAFNAGESYSFTTTHGWTSQNVRIWIDFNNDGVFSDDATERVSSASGDYTTNGTISIPGDVSGGTFRMRVATRFSSAPVPCNTAGYGETHDYMASITVPSCPAPTALTASNITINSADLSWISDGNTFDIKWGLSGFDFETEGLLVEGFANGGTLSGLAHTTAYQYYVRQDCGGGDISSWVGPFNFTTTQILGAFPFEEDFEGAVNWSFVNGTQNNKWHIGTAVNNGGSNAMYVSNDGGVSNAYTVSGTSVTQAYREIAVPAEAGIVSFSFDWKGMGEDTNIAYDYFRVWLVPSTYTPTAGTQISVSNSGGVQVGSSFYRESEWQSYSDTALDLSAFAGTTMKLVFEWRNDGSAGTGEPAAIDNISLVIPDCPTPLDLNAENATLTSIDLSWSGSGSVYEIRWGVVEFDIDDATSIPVTGESHTLSATGGYYEFVVREICGSGESDWSNRYAFYVPNVGEDCSAPIVIGALPYTTTDDTANYTDNPNIEGAPGDCSTNNYLNGNDVVYAYTAAFDGVINVQLTGLTATYAGIFAYASCADIGVACIGSAFGGGATDRGFEMNVADGDTYYFVISTWASPQTVGYTLDISQVLCAKPTGVDHADVTHNSANVSWDVSGDYEINWGTGTFTAGDGDNTDTVNNTTEFAFSGLNGSTTYRYFVRQNCGGTDGDSEWVGPFTFTTLLAPASIPWMEGFTTTTIPTGWAQTGFSFGAPAGITSAPGGVEGNVIYKNLYGTGSNASGNFQTINMGLVSSGDILSFIHRVSNWSSPYAPPVVDSGNFIVAISTDNGVNYTNIQTITNDGVSEGWQDFEYDLSSYEGEYVRIRISATRTAGDYYLAFDNFYVGQPITCEAPSALTATNITANTADLSWTSEGSTFDISWGAGVFDAEDGTIVSLANGGTLSGLTPQTAYQYYVRQNCGVGDASMWAGPFGFTTDCTPLTSLDENFDSYGTGSIVPDCWVRLAPATSVGSQTISLTTPASGTRNIYQYAGSTSNPVIVVLPSFSNINDGTHWLKFKARVGSGAPGALHVGYVTDATDYDSFVLIETLSITNTSYTTDAEYTVVVPTSVPAGAKLAIKNAADAKSYYWDDVIWEEVPSCISPSALTASNITTNTADLSWTSEGSTFDISWGAGAFDAEDGTIVSLANGGTLSGLTAQTTYQYYVRQNCGVGDVSLWVGPYSFTTACEAFDLPYSQDFEGVTAPSLPSCTSIETLNGNPWRTSSSAVTGMTGNKLNYTYHASGTGTADAWFYTPGLNLEAGKNYAISYKYGNNTTFYTERMKVAYGTSAMASVMNEVLADHNAINSTGVSENEVFFTVAEDGVYYFGFQSYSIANQNQLYLDDILIRELGDDCTGTPDAGIATASLSSGESGTAVDFAATGYDNTAEGLSYDWEYSTDSGASWESIGVSDNEVTFTITGTIGTVFQVRYAATCSFSESTGYSNELTFTVTQPLDYCVPTYTNTGDRVSAVSSTDAVSDITYTNSTGGQHYDQTNMILETTPGQQFTLNTTYVGGGQTMGVWIDWGNNNTFDDLGDRIVLDYGTPLTKTFTITIPSGTDPGDYRMRVRGAWNNHVADGDAFACNEKSYGSSVDFTIRVAAPCSAEWTGAVSTDWNNAANWCDNAVPTAGSDVVINVANPVIISTDVTVNSITLGSDASLTVNETLTVGDISVAVGGGFTVTYGAGLLQPETAVNTGDITVKVEAGTEWFGYNMFSSSVVGQSFSGFSPNNGGGVYTYFYNNATNHGYTLASGSEFAQGLGYLFSAPYDGFPLGELTTFYGEFTGVPNNGDVSVSVNADTYAALGNPYPSAIDADDFLAANPHIGTLYFWTNANFYDYANSEYPGYNYATYTSLAGTGTSGDVTYAAPNGTIAVGQGFMAAVVGTGPVAFDNAMRIDASGTLYKALAQDKHRMWLNLNNSTNMLNQIVIGYMEGASMGVDNGIDGPMFDYDGSSLYSLIENSDVNYTIQGRYPFATSDVVPLGFKATTTDNYTISLVDFDGLFAEGQDIYLLDHFTTSLVNLKDTDYSFVSEPGVFDTRFEIVYNSTMSISNPTLDNSWVVYKQNGHLQILAEGFDMKQVVVIDMLGRIIYQATAEGRTHQLPELGANAVLIIKVISTDNQTSTKKVVH